MPLEGPPRELPPNLYSIFGEEKIRKMLRIHYKNLKNSEISHLFPDDEESLNFSAEKNADFFIQVLGGPPYFSQKYGPPMMRKRHLNFRITRKDRDVWLKCFLDAFDIVKKEVNLSSDQEKSFIYFLENFSIWMVNSK